MLRKTVILSQREKKLFKVLNNFNGQTAFIGKTQLFERFFSPESLAIYILFLFKN